MPMSLVPYSSDRGATTKLVAPDCLQITGATPEEVGTLAAQRSIPIFEATTEVSDLEDIFLELTSHDSTERTTTPKTR